jgi:hypothetical protein
LPLSFKTVASIFCNAFSRFSRLEIRYSVSSE